MKIYIADPEFEVPDSDILHLLALNPDSFYSQVSAVDEIVRRKGRAYAGYISNAFETPEAFADRTLPTLVAAAVEWADAEWMGYP